MLLSDTTVDGVPINTLSRCSEKRVRRECDGCKRVDDITWSSFLKRKGPETLCRGCATRRTMKNGPRRVAHNKGVPGLRGSSSPSWRGGRRLDAHGYTMVHAGRPKTDCGWEAYVKEHVLVVEKSIGRKLLKHEVVHHIDGCKTSNRVENLFLTNHAGHKDAHQSLQEIGYELTKAGLIRFDRASGTYKAHDKLRELLEHPEAGNQQPSASSNAGDGSTTRRESDRETEDDNSPTSAGHVEKRDDIV